MVVVPQHGIAGHQDLAESARLRAPGTGSSSEHHPPTHHSNASHKGGSGSGSVPATPPPERDLEVHSKLGVVPEGELGGLSEKTVVEATQ